MSGGRAAILISAFQRFSISAFVFAIAIATASAVGPLPPVPASESAKPATPIKNGKLTSDLNAGEFNITNGAYFNFGPVSGFSGYGLRDNSGTIEFKNSGGVWSVLGTGGEGDGGGTVTSIGIAAASSPNAGITISGSPITTSGDITLGINWATITPGTLSVSSTNAATGTTHTHVITASSDPGAASALLKTDSSGYLKLVRLLLGSTSAGFTGTGTIINPLTGDSIRSTTFTSGISGWNLDDAGNLEANNITARGELRSSVFKVNEIAATAGTLGVFKSAANLNADVTTPASTSSSFTFQGKNSDAGGMLFAVSDAVRFKAWTGAGVSDSWATITARTNNTTYTTYTATLNSGSTSATYRAGSAIIDYGPSGTGFITLSADGTVGSSPNLTMATHAGNPWSAQTTLLRLGNLNGSYNYVSDTYGLGIGDYSTDEYITFDLATGLILHAAGGAVTLDSNGLLLSGGLSSVNAVRWYNAAGGTDAQAQIRGSFDTDTAAWQAQVFADSSDTTQRAYAELSAWGAQSGSQASVSVYAGSTAHADYPDQSFIELNGNSVTGTFLGVTIGQAFGATKPTHKLDVWGNGWFRTDAFVPTGANVINSGILTDGFYGGGVTMKDGTFYAGGWCESSTLRLGVGTASGLTPYLQVAAAGNRFPSYGAGTLTTDASGNITASSDERLKDIDGPYTRGLADLREIKPINYHWKTSTGLDRTETYTGVSAQNVAENVPEAVGIAPDGTYTVNDRALIATLINANNELAARLEKLEAASGIKPEAAPKPDRKKIAGTRLADLKTRMEKRVKAEQALAEKNKPKAPK